MSNDPTSQFTNPYAAPAHGSIPVALVAGDDVRKLVKQYRSQMHALGGLWIVLGVLAIGVGTAGFFLTEDLAADLDEAMAIRMVLFGIVAAIGTGWALLGVMTCLKHMWAVYVGLVLCYLSLVSNLISFDFSKIIALAILGAAIVQSHRVISWAKDLKRKGVPLTTRPEAIQTPVNMNLPVS